MREAYIYKHECAKSKNPSEKVINYTAEESHDPK